VGGEKGEVGGLKGEGLGLDESEEVKRRAGIEERERDREEKVTAGGSSEWERSRSYATGFGERGVMELSLSISNATTLVSSDRTALQMRSEMMNLLLSRTICLPIFAKRLTLRLRRKVAKGCTDRQRERTSQRAAFSFQILNGRLYGRDPIISLFLVLHYAEYLNDVT
jgi:hypothetical protein